MTPLDLEALREEMYEKSPYKAMGIEWIEDHDIAWRQGVNAVIDYLKEKENG